MSLDIVKCLRECDGTDAPWAHCLMQKAADEIERLRSENAALFLTNGDIANTIGADALRLRAALSRIANCGQSAEPDHWKFRCMARETAQAALQAND